MKFKTEVVKIVFDVEIHYTNETARAAAIKEASDYFKKVSSSQGYWINSKITGKLV